MQEFKTVCYGTWSQDERGVLQTLRLRVRRTYAEAVTPTRTLRFTERDA